ncbi:hypothetical protein [Pseudomonas sp. TE3610]
MKQTGRLVIAVMDVNHPVRYRRAPIFCTYKAGDAYPIGHGTLQQM